MSDKYILRDRRPVAASLEAWAAFFEDIANRRVAEWTSADGRWRVSTVFLGLDHAHFGGPPLLFETMSWFDGEEHNQQRCATWAQAEVLHEKAVAVAASRPVGPLGEPRR